MVFFSKILDIVTYSRLVSQGLKLIYRISKNTCDRFYTVGMRPLSIVLRKRVVAVRHVDGKSMRQIAERFEMPMKDE